MFKKFYPDYFAVSAYALDYEALYARGLRGVIFDIDNTLVFHDAPADGRACALFARLRGIGIKTCLLSNNEAERVRPFAEAVGADVWISKAGKPLPDKYLAALARLGCGKQEAVFVGDQLFTDVWGAKNAGITSYLVEPLGPEKLLKIKAKRVLERIVLAGRHRRHGGSCR